MLENIQYSITSNISTTTNLDYASSSFDEGEESDSYDIRKFDLKYNNNNHRWSVSSSSSNSTTHETLITNSIFAHSSPPPPQQQQERNLTAQTKSQSTIPDIECRKRKLERNRIAAKQCRERKKIYVAKLESKVTRLEEENAHLRRELDELNTRLQFNPVDAQERLGLHVLIEDLKSKVNNEIIKMGINQNKI
ncbi:10601_t:CDS:2 [Entrophospora sp. SA101]|nr:10601_t:CDS:2 [Entrophospora sp. SA101]CAJ0864944.1 6958_t:CDS:2 [Entrophospora sp. SA101]